MSKRIIAIFTGNRAEYGLQFPILQAIQKHPDLEYRLIVSGAHLEDNFGKTVKEIEGDGFNISEKVFIEEKGDIETRTAYAIGFGVSALAAAFRKVKPDIVLVYADRFEGFAAIIAASQMNIPTAHVEGGDITEGGALDDSVRHAMTKLSHLHFTTNIQATNRVLAMGEESWRVNTVGLPTADTILNNNYATEEELVSSFNLKSGQPIIIFTQHSITTDAKSSVDQLKPSLAALIRMANQGIRVMLTYPNNDSGGNEIVKILNDLAQRDLPNLQIFNSLGRRKYHGILGLARAKEWHVVCAGNSSSGIKETPFFGVPTVNIGTRQLGRLRGDNVLDVDYNEQEIIEALNKCLYDRNFIKKSAATFNPYGSGRSGEKIAQVLSTVDLSPNVILKKKMTLIGEHKEGWFR